MYRAKSFMCFGLIFGTILTMCDSLWAQKKVSIVIWFDKKQTFEAFQPVATLEKPFGKWINTDTFNVDVIIDGIMYLTNAANFRILGQRKTKGSCDEPLRNRQTYGRPSAGVH